MPKYISNTTITPKVIGKPHIVLINNWWRVSSLPVKNRSEVLHIFSKAHSVISDWNSSRHET